MRVLKSKKGIAWSMMAKAIIFLVVVAIVIYAFMMLFGGGAGAVGELLRGIGTYEQEAQIGGTSNLDQSCTSSWDCQLNLACVDNKCQPSITTKIEVHGKQNCRDSYASFLEKGVIRGADCSSYIAGKYLLEIKSGSIKDGGSGYIKKGEDTGKSQWIFIYAGTESGVPYTLEDYGFTRSIADKNDGKYKYPMSLNNIYDFESIVKFRICGWVKDTDCGGNSGSVTIRVDRISGEGLTQEELTQEEICTDTEDETDYAVKGNVTGTYKDNSGNIYEFVNKPDVCTSEEYLTEFFCSGEEVKAIFVECIKEDYTKCEDGRCI